MTHFAASLTFIPRDQAHKPFPGVTIQALATCNMTTWPWVKITALRNDQAMPPVCLTLSFIPCFTVCIIFACHLISVAHNFICKWTYLLTLHHTVYWGQTVMMSIKCLSVCTGVGTVTSLHKQELSLGFVSQEINLKHSGDSQKHRKYMSF